MLKVTKSEYNQLLNQCRCKVCICENVCFQEGLSYNSNNKDCNDNTQLVVGAKKIIEKSKLTVAANYRY